MDLYRDFEDLLSELCSANARFLIVGAYAVALHAEPRYTKDLDLWVEPTPENARRVWTALARFGAPLDDIAASEFTNPKLVYQIGIEPIRVDILTHVDGCEFETAWRNRLPVRLGRVSCAALGRADLIRSKRAVGRPQDLRDLELLGAAPKRRTRRTPRR